MDLLALTAMAKEAGLDFGNTVVLISVAMYMKRDVKKYVDDKWSDLVSALTEHKAEIEGRLNKVETQVGITKENK